MSRQPLWWPERGSAGGRYFPVDADGFIANTLDSIERQPAWEPLVQHAIALLLSTLGGACDSLYLRGSVAEGRAWSGTSDVDLIAITRDRVDLAADVAEIAHTIESAHPIAREVVIDVFSLDELRYEERLAYLRVVVVAQACLLWGADRRAELPPARPGWGMVFAAWTLEQRHVAFVTALRSGGDPAARTLRIQAFFRAALRSGFELFEEEIGLYTRDIDLCAAVLVAAAPERRDLFDASYQRALDLVVPVPDDVLAERFMSWFLAERRRRVP